RNSPSCPSAEPPCSPSCRGPSRSATRPERPHGGSVFTGSPGLSCHVFQVQVNTSGCLKVTESPPRAQPRGESAQVRTGELGLGSRGQGLCGDLSSPVRPPPPPPRCPAPLCPPTGSLLLESLKDHISTTAQDHCKAIYLHVLTTNNTAINFYENRDFKQHHYLPYYYSIRGVLKDGFTYVLYINGGHPPWTVLDYIQHLGSALANLSPCSIPHRIYRQAHSLLCSFLPWSGISTKGGIEYSRTM
uniref:histone acetyltransferase n=1 Tax=Sus scrofa TaxID=9823 RepID=A0A8D1R944_PIG